MLILETISKTYKGPDGPVTVLNSLSLTVTPGEVVAVQGPSGSGKTTLLLIAGGLLKPDTGVVAVDRQSVYELSPNGRSGLRAEKIGFVFQQFHLIPYLTVLENVLAPSVVRPDPGAREHAQELIRHFRIDHRMNHVPAQLSMGECQRVALARALLNDPAVILADEPTGNLDEENGHIILQYLAEFAKQDRAVLIVTHDAQVFEYTHRRVSLGTVG
jgi:putative ABC transport system ATP-binding protein